MPLINFNVFHIHRIQIKADKRKRKNILQKKNVDCSHTFEQIENFMLHWTALTYIIVTRLWKLRVQCALDTNNKILNCLLSLLKILFLQNVFLFLI
jgi:hypothetical protein